jgi:3',5'-cyclic AMP phosphodiesterase CpdA
VSGLRASAFALAALFGSALIGSAAACGAPAGTAAGAVFAAGPPAAREGARFVVVGDLQRTAPVLEAWREQNDAERERVVAAIADVRPELLLITGDCVFDGASDAQWEAFDVLTSPLRAAAIPTVVAFGNHEYWRGRAGAEAHVFSRFPLDARRHWLSVALGPVRLIVLDSNEDGLGAAAWASESAWYEQTLTAFDADDSVRAVFVAFHHPPFTNSTVTGDEPSVQRAFVPAFARARKTLAMLNGHVHSYERYVRDGKTYVVSGGGGGPRATLATGAARRHPDDAYDGPALRDFNFTVYSLTEHGVAAEVRGLGKGASAWSVLDRFELLWPPASP